jgi:uncharacterized protein
MSGWAATRLGPILESTFMHVPLIHTTHQVIPSRAGLGLKTEHYRAILDTKPDIGFFEVHAENYMGAGGPPHRYLSAISERYPLSLHGVGLSIGGKDPLDKKHLGRLKELLQRYQPGLFSEHLAWSTHETGFFHDLLPLPYTNETLKHVTDHIDEVQTTLRRQMLLENPSTYLNFSLSTYRETDFISEVVRRTGCGLLLDVNNVFVASTNQQSNPFEYIDAYPLASVQEIHLAGHTRESGDYGERILIDTHNAPVDDLVWDLFRYTVRLTGPIPTLIEWDASVPEFSLLRAEAGRAEAIMSTVNSKKALHASAR